MRQLCVAALLALSAGFSLRNPGLSHVPIRDRMHISMRSDLSHKPLVSPWLPAGALASLPAAALASDGLVEMQADSVNGWLSTEIGQFFLKTVISWGVPSLALVVVTIFAAIAFSRPGPGNEEDELPPKLAALLGKPSANPEPKEYLKVERLNDKMSSYSYSLQKATVNKASALQAQRRTAFTRRFGDEVGSLSDAQLESISKAEIEFQKSNKKVTEKLAKITGELREMAVMTTPKQSNKTAATAEDSGAASGMPNMMEAMSMGRRQKALRKQLASVVSEQAEVETTYVQAVSKVLSAVEREKLGRLLKKGGTGSWQESPLALDPEELAAPQQKHVFVMEFFGDIQASQVEQLRQEITAVLSSANSSRGDEVLLVLNSGGGTVTGYGLAASQLARIKDHGLPLTICVEQVAASGGYMMACTADKLVASPFAVLGSIGVISEQPNVYERLKKEGVEFQTVTAGKYKRTITPFKKVTREDIDKSKEDIEDILVLFKAFVAQHRPVLDIDKVATGETWFGKDALDQKLVDELKTVDDILMDHLAAGAQIFSVKYSDKAGPLASLLPSAAAAGAAAQLLDRRPQGPRWKALLLEALLGAWGAEQESQPVGRVGTWPTQSYGPANAYMARDPTFAEDSYRIND